MTGCLPIYHVTGAVRRLTPGSLSSLLFCFLLMRLRGWVKACGVISDAIVASVIPSFTLAFFYSKWHLPSCVGCVGSLFSLLNSMGQASWKAYLSSLSCGPVNPSQGF